MSIYTHLHHNALHAIFWDITIEMVQIAEIGMNGFHITQTSPETNFGRYIKATSLVSASSVQSLSQSLFQFLSLAELIPL